MTDRFSPAERIALGGSCYWCLEAVFQSLIGVERVEQGFVAATDENHDETDFCEAVIVHFDPQAIPLSVLIEIHLHTHHCTADHSMRERYRSAVYVFDEQQAHAVEEILATLQSDFMAPLVTRVLPFASFKPSQQQYHDYFYTNPQRPFCERWIAPKLRILLERFSDSTDQQKLRNAGLTDRSSTG
ncbi:peptide-methionine (S)-S-oxide reductase [Halomonas huangheensis]|uniref:peptide-methionine (S)-S-oxide reductase n=1 Tax=Halomonas huangheensis TaxID=1178482 RepID=W1N8L2_9GAMM|nr:peptide-methionine (S)-S-oxide reductase [Halomonas huangheensis]ALM53422.1 peptide methionine sulfoxide reductase [Halomonas huangheensis]ERL51912.1 hypothetical protein BJB45_12150 [Halomonas huangheensis]